MSDSSDFRSPLSSDLMAFGPQNSLTQDLMSLGDSKKNKVAEKAVEKKSILGESPLRAATAVEEGNDLGTDPMIEEIANSTTNEITAKYGSRAGDVARNFYLAREHLGEEEARRRTGAELARDTGLGVVAGAAQGLGGIAAFGTGLVNDRAGAAVADFSRGVGDDIRGAQSDDLEETRRLAGVRGQLDKEDIGRQFDQDVENDVAYPELRRFGREVLSAGSDMVENPALAGDIAAEGIGSLVGSIGVGGVITKGAVKVILKARGMSAAQATSFLKTPAGQEFSRRVANGTMPGAIGALEGGGAYSQIQGEIQSMSEAELAEGSPEYVDLRREGMGHEEARDRIANMAAVEGGAIQGLIGALVGKATGASKFEASIGRGSAKKGSGSLTESLSDIGSNILKETTEEGLQEGSATAVTNLEVQRYADEDRDLSEGIGQNVVAGIVGGAGTGAAVQVPRAAQEGATAAGRAAGQAVESRLNRIETERDAESPVGQNAVREAGEELQSSLNTLEETVATTTVPESSGDEEQAQPENSLTPERIRDLSGVSGAELNALPENIQKTFNDSGEEIAPDEVLPRFMILEGTLEEVRSGNLDEADNMAASLWINDQAQKLQALRSVDTSNMSEEARQGLLETQRTVDTILASPEVRKAVKAAQEATSESLGTMPEITEENLSSPEVRKAISQQTSLARSNPAGVDPRFIDTLLSQKVPTQMDAATRGALQAASELRKEADRAEEAKKALVAETQDALTAAGNTRKPLKTVDGVRDQIKEQGKSNDNNQWSLRRHVSEVSSAIARGETDQARVYAENLGNFAQHMQNKLAAARESYGMRKRTDNKVAFRTWTGSRWIEPGQTGASQIGVSPFSPTSVQFAKEVSIDAASVARTYNSLLSAYPDMLNTYDPIDFTDAEGSFDMTQEAQADETASVETAQTDAEVTDGTEGERREAGTGEAQEQDPQASEQAGNAPDAADGDPAGERAVEEAAEAPAKDSESQESGEAGPSEEDQGVADGGVDGGVEPPSFEHLPKNRDGVSRFNRAFTIDPESSALITNETPVAGVVEMLENIDSFSADLELDYPLDAERAKVFAGVIREHVVGMAKRANARLNQKMKTFQYGKKGNKTQLTPLEALDPEKNQGIDFTGQKHAYTLNLVDQEAGTYDQRLLGTAVLAALDWVMTTTTDTNPKPEDVAKDFGLSQTEVNADMMWAARNGMNQTRAKESLARTIQEFWGAEVNRDAPDSDVRGITEGLAAELLVAMEGSLITKREIRVGETANGKPKYANTVELRHKSSQERMKELRPVKTFLTDVFLPEADKPVYFDEVPNKPLNRQKGNLIGNLSDKVLKAVENHRKIAHYRNTPLTGLMAALGRETWLDLRGHTGFDPETTHIKHAGSIEGVNQSLERSWDETMAHGEKLEHVAARDGKNPDEIASHFDYFVGSNDRIMSKGFNGQSNKTMREAYAPTRAVLDMTMPENVELFWLTVAQSTDMAEVENTPHDQIFATIEEDVRKAYPRTLEIFTDWLQTGDAEALSEENKTALLGELRGKDGASDKLIHALMAVARYDVAREEGVEALQAFDHRLSFEADGKTDGPINALVHFALGRFTKEQLANYAKGGFFINQRGQTLNQHNLKDRSDLYQAAAVLAQENLVAMQERLAGNKPASSQMKSLMNVMANLGEIELNTETGDIKIGRKALKNPLTITMYGSTANGMARKIAAGLTDVLYARFSELLALRSESGNAGLRLTDLESLKGYDGIWDDLSALMGLRVDLKEDGSIKMAGGRADVDLPAESSIRDLKTFVFSPGHMDTLVENVKTLYVAPLVDAIDETTGGAIGTTKVLQAATQVQSLTFLESFKNVVEQEIARKVAAGELRQGETLSAKQYDDIYKELSKLGAVIESVDGTTEDSFHINLSKPERVKADGGLDRKMKRPRRELSRGLDDEYSGPGGLNLPSTAGVSATPMLTISRGDARMMVNYFASEDPSLRTLQVFDGLEVSADDIKGVSERINAAVAEGWMENPLANVEESFNDFLKQSPVGKAGPLEGIDDANVYDAIWDALASARKDPMQEKRAQERFEKIVSEAAGSTIPGRKFKDAEARRKFLTENSERLAPVLKVETDKELVRLRDKIRTMSQEAQARKTVLSKLDHSVDHMAGGQSPYTFEGETLTAPTDGALASAMNRRYERELTRIRKKAEEKAARPKVEAPDPEFEALIEKHGYPVKTRLGEKVDGTVRRLSVKGIRAVMEDSKLSKDAWAIYQAMEPSLPRFKVLIASAEDLNAYRDRFHPELSDTAPIELGQVDHANGIIYLANAAPETMLHELLHATTSAATFDYYGNPESLSDERKAAVSNLEGLMTQFMGLDFSNEDANAANVAETVQAEIAQYLRNEDEVVGKTAALQEFMAWSLTNQNLADALRKTKNRTPLMRLAHKALLGLKRLLGLATGQNLDMFSNIQWNTAALIRMSPKNRLTAAQRRSRTPVGLVMNQVSPNSDKRLQRLMERFDRSVASPLRQMSPDQKMIEDQSILNLTNKMVNLVTSSGFDLDPQQVSAFRSIQAAMASSMEMDKGALLRAQELFTATIKDLSVESLMNNPEPDAQGNQDPNDRAQAQEKFNLLVGKYGTETDRQGRSTVLSTFLALSQIDPSLRRALERQPIPENTKINPKRQSLDEILETAADNLIGRLSNRIIKGDARGTRVGPVIDKLAVILSEGEKQDATVMETMAQEFIGENNNRVSAVLSKGGELLTSLVTPKDARDQASDIRKVLDKGLEGLDALVTQDKDKRKAAIEVMSSIRNAPTKIPDFALKLVDEIVGITDENRPVYGLMNPVRYSVSRIRQIFRQDMPKVLSDKFTRKLDDAEWSQLHMGLAKTDLAALGEKMSVRNIRKMITDASKLDLEISKAEEELQGLAQKDLYGPYVLKAKDLAKFMIRGEVDPDNHMLARNAEAIASLAGGEVVVENNSADLVSSIDRLTSLYALKELEPHTIGQLSDLAQEQTEGFDYLIYYLLDLRSKEKAKTKTGMSRMNGYKGYVPSDAREGVSLVVSDDADHNRLVSLGYTRQGDYEGSDFESGRKGYYYSNVGGSAIFSQGIMQTVRNTAQGVDIHTGRTLTGITGGFIQGPEAKIIADKILKGNFKPRGEALLPIFDETGAMIGFERSMAPEQITKMRKNTHLGEMIGAWAGRHVEEAMAQTYNNRLVGSLHEIWERDSKRGRRDEFIDLSDKSQTNEIEKDAWNAVPRETRAEIERLFGDEGFMVRRDMIDNTVGYRNFSIGEAWTGPSNMHPDVKKVIKGVAAFLPGLGPNAFKRMVTAQKALEAGVGVAKNIVVVLSVVVPVANAASNILQTLNNGVSVRDIIKGVKTKLVELERMQKLEKRRVELTAERARHRNNDVELRKIDAEEKSISDAISRMSIAPMVEAGEFTSLVEGETEQDAAITQGSWIEKVQEMMERVPEKLGTVGRYAAITRDTALFKGMSRSVQYGDFIAKSIVYDHMVKKQGKSKEEALNHVVEEFVAYNFLPSRVRKTAENLGMSWFWAYKLRSIKVAHRLLRDNPLRLLMTSFSSPLVPDVPGVNVGSPVSDNAVSAIAEGRAGYTLGPGMLFRAPGLHPVLGDLAPF